MGGDVKVIKCQNRHHKQLRWKKKLRERLAKMRHRKKFRNICMRADARKFAITSPIPEKVWSRHVMVIAPNARNRIRSKITDAAGKMKTTFFVSIL